MFRVSQIKLIMAKRRNRYLSMLLVKAKVYKNNCMFVLKCLKKTTEVTHVKFI